jgi:CubicO group peptidase (beta-lactamase class C family)
VPGTGYSLERVDALAARLIAAGATPGAAVAIADRERILAVRSYGHADPAAGLPVDGHTLFQIGSISKSYTALCLLRRWERGELDLDAEVATLLPWFPVAGVTVHHLLSHTGGLICSLGDPPSPAWEVLSLAATARAPAGERFWYSNVGYQALGFVLERLTGEPYADTYRREIIAPLGLRETEPVLCNALRDRVAVGYAPLADNRPWRLGNPLAPAPWLEYAGADGSVCATVADLARYGQMLLNDGAGVLSADGFARLATPVAEDPDDDAWYGYGVMLRTVAGRRWIGHSGSMVAHNAQLWCDRDAGLVVAAFVNGKTGSKLLAEHALRLAAGDELADPGLEEVDDPAAAVALDAEPAAEWRAICGHYRSHNPWATTLVVGTRAGAPMAIHWGDAWPLTPLGDGSFRLGADGWNPERLRFDTPLDGLCMRAWHGATALHRPTASMSDPTLEAEPDGR